MRSQHDHTEYRETPVVEHHDDGGAWVGMLFALVVIVGLLVALFVWSPWAGTGTGDTTPNDTNINIRGDFNIPNQGGGGGTDSGGQAPSNGGQAPSTGSGSGQ